MKTENLQIITGTPKEAAAAAEAYLNSNENAEILGTAVTVHHVAKQREDGTKKPAAKKAAKNAANAPKDEPQAEELKAVLVEMEPQVLVAITVARVWR